MGVFLGVCTASAKQCLQFLLLLFLLSRNPLVAYTFAVSC